MVSWNCDPDTSYHPTGHVWAHCLGDEEECLEVKFTEASADGRKAAMWITRSWNSKVLTLIRGKDDPQYYDGDEARWRVTVLDIFGKGTSASAKIEICYEEVPTTCTQSFTASADVGELTFTPSILLYKGSVVDATKLVGAYNLPADVPDLTSGDIYTAHPLLPADVTDFTAPDDVTFVACADTINFVYTKVSPPPDVTITDWALPSSANPGDTLAVSVTVENNSSTEAASIKALVSGVNQTTGYPLSSGYVETTISASDTVEISCPIDVPDDADVGTYQLTPTVYASDGTLLDTGTTKTIDIQTPVTDVTCDGNSPNYGTGCDLLKHFDANNNGSIDFIEWSNAVVDRNNGVITEEELNFITAAYGLGSGGINLKCPGCYVIPVTCDGNSPNYGTGCALLLHYDGDDDGIIGAVEVNTAISDHASGLITKEELDFVMMAWKAGSINALCEGCYEAPECTQYVCARDQDDVAMPVDVRFTVEGGDAPFSSTVPAGMNRELTLIEGVSYRFTIPSEYMPSGYECIDCDITQTACGTDIVFKFRELDTTDPVIRISSPANGTHFSSGTSSITVSGTSSDNVGVSKVEVKVGSGSWQTASGTTSWSKTVSIATGANTITARATDTSENTKETSITVYRDAPCPNPSVSDISWSPSSPKTGESVSFSQTSSAGSGQSIASYDWDWGDGSPHGSGAAPSHTYGTAGSYNVRLTVTNSCGKTASRTETITITAPPPTCVAPTISSISLNPASPKLCDKIQFTTGTIHWNDVGVPETTTRAVRWYYSKDEVTWTQFSTEQWPTYAFTDPDDVDVQFIRCSVRNKCGLWGSFTTEVTIGERTGLCITVDSSLEGKPLFVGNVVKIIGTDLWYLPITNSYAEWDSVRSSTTYVINDDGETPEPDSGVSGFSDGDDCVVLVKDVSMMLGSAIFKNEDVFKLDLEDVSCIHLDHTSNDVLTEAIMGPVCDFFSIPRGSECDAFWAEFNDPVFIADYISILTTGKDRLGNERELTIFDHLALPFAIIGTVAPEIPVGKFVSKGLEGVWKGGRHFSNAAVNWMLDFVTAAPTSVISEAGDMSFMDAIVRISPEHIDEVMGLIADEKFDDALEKITEYLESDFGKVDWWDWRTFNDKLRDAIEDIDAYKWLRRQAHLPVAEADSVIKTASKAAPDADDVAKLADAATDTQVMDEAVDAVYDSLKHADADSNVELKLANVLKNDSEIASKLVARYETLLKGVIAGTPLTIDETAAIINHCEVAPKDIVDIVMGMQFDERAELINRLADGTHQHALAGLFHKISDSYELVLNAKGRVATDALMRGYAATAMEALRSGNPARMSGITEATHDFAKTAAKAASDRGIDEDLIFGFGRTGADEIVDAADNFIDESTDAWHTKARIFVGEKLSGYWTSIRGMSRREKFMAVWWFWELTTFVIGFMLLKAFGLFPSDRSFRQWGHSEAIDKATWLCKNACKEHRYADLADAIEILEDAITDAETYLNDNESALKREHSYESNLTAIKVGKATLKLMQECLANGDWDVDDATGSIEFTCNEVCAAYIDDKRVGTVYPSGLFIEFVNVGEYTLKMWKSGFSECEETRTVVEGEITEFDCQMTSGECPPVYTVGISYNPSKPLVNETIDFVGSATTGDGHTITDWLWKFGDFEESTDQNPQHRYDVSGHYTVSLEATNDCGETRTETDTIWVIDEPEEPEPGAASLYVKAPIDEDGNLIDPYWDTEIWIDGQYTKYNTPHSFLFGSGAFCDKYPPGNLIPCELGTHEVTVKKTGYNDASKTFDMRDTSDLRSQEWQPVMTETITGPKASIDSIDYPTDPVVAGTSISVATHVKNIGNQSGTFYVKYTKNHNAFWTSDEEEIASGATTVFDGHPSLVMGDSDISIVISVWNYDTGALDDVKTIVIRHLAADTHEVTFDMPEDITLYIDDELVEGTTIHRLLAAMRRAQNE